MVDTSAPAPTDDVAQLIASLKDAPVFVAKGFPTAVEHGPAGLSESLTSIAEAASRGDSASEIGNLKIGYITPEGGAITIPQVREGGEAAVEYLNNNGGGVNGHEGGSDREW